MTEGKDLGRVQGLGSGALKLNLEPQALRLKP